MTKILSVSVATYNASKTIEQCLDSFINSKYVRLGMSRILCNFLEIFVIFSHQRAQLFINKQLIQAYSPIGQAMWIPFLIEFQDSKIEDFKNSVFIRKWAFLRNLAEAGIYAFNSVGRVHYLAYGAALIKKLLDVLEVVFPDGDGAGISLPVLLKLVENQLRFFYHKSLSAALRKHATASGEYNE